MKPLIFGCNIVDLLQLTGLIGLGIYDLYRYLSGKKTISQRVHDWFGPIADGGILVSLLVAQWAFFGPSWFIPVMWGVILGHLFWYQKD